ncbi:hypothetical protein H5410_046391 [Solanum commersonii]|uniref:Uncharacterized protein n=1 Tax=Solanum commersonii TaxID=4109 RepID=A0A9J5XE75_SOLCO|nr:hypothetical protein H5410_046391 [Solanum commersonii]
MKNKLLPKRGISLDKVEETLSTFHKDCWRPIGYALQLNLARQINNGCESFIKTVPWGISNDRILCPDLTGEVKTCMSICVLEDILLNIGHLIVNESRCVVKSKLRKIDSGKSVHVDDYSCIPPTLGPFESLESEL